MQLFVLASLAQILEVSSAFYPEKNAIFSPEDSYILPSQHTFVQFGGQQILDKQGNKKIFSTGSEDTYSKIVCGPSPFINTMNCFSTAPVGFKKSVPIPGNVSTTPVLVDHSWVIGTTKGFLLKIKTKSETDDLPDVDPDSTELWGSSARQVMDDFVPKTIYREAGGTEKSTEAIKIPKNYFWLFPTSSPFVGTPIVHNGVVYALTANQLLYAIDFMTGKFIWSVKIGSDASFSLENVSLRVVDNKVVIGTMRGHLLVLDAVTGNHLHDVNISSDVTIEENLFSGITAPPFVCDDNTVIVSNVASDTKRISIDTAQVVWTYAEGSITTPVLGDSETILLATSSGKVVSVNLQTGTTNWSTNLHKISPLVDLTLTEDKKTILVSTKRGELIALDAKKGKVLVENRAIGTTVGFFFKTADQLHDSCMTFSTGSFRCFRMKF